MMYISIKIMHHRTTINLDQDALREAAEARPGLTTTALVNEGLRLIAAQEAANRLAQMEGIAPDFRRPRRSAWNDEHDPG
jgi:hypothetical protein